MSNMAELNITPDLIEGLEVEAEEVNVEINGLEDELPRLRRQLDALWEGNNEIEYELVSVFMHRGEPFSIITSVGADQSREDKRRRSLLDVSNPPPRRRPTLLQIQRRDSDRSTRK